MAQASPGAVAVILSGPFSIASAAPIEPANVTAHSTERPAIIALSVEHPPRLDGVLDDTCWDVVRPLTNFTQVVPIAGASPSERTEARFVFTRDALYIGIRCFDSEPEKILATDMRRDSDFDSDDSVLIALDTFDRRHDGYFFMVNPLSARTDGLIQDFSERKFEWDGIWDVRSRRDETGWTVEMAIPFKSLSFDPRHDTWGCNIERIIRRKQEVVRWTAALPSRQATTLADFGRLHGFVDLRQGIGLELRPFLSFKYSNVANDDDDWELKPGGDVTYRITPSLTANATFNTDFAEAEVDDRIVNLTRFPTFFPEKRDFFLQDSSLFSFGGLRGSPTPYYSRRIGLSGNGEPVDIIAGGRLTGRIGDTQIALLDVQQEGYDAVPSKNLFVGRVSTKVFEESNVGMIATHGDPRIAGDNTLLGLDFNYLNSRLPQGKQLIGRAWLMGTESDRYGSRDGAFGAVLDYPNEPWSANAQVQHFGEEFDPALGFVSRRGIRNYNAHTRYLWRPNTALLRSISIWSRAEFLTDLDNRIISENTDPFTIEFRTPAGDELELQYGFDRDVLDEPFEIQPGITIPMGNYWDGHVMASVGTSETRPVSAWFRFRHGGFYTGRKDDYNFALDWRPSAYFRFGADYEFSRVQLAEGDFDVHIVACRATVGFTPNLTWATLVQYDNLSDDFGLNSRVRWTWRPGNDLFFVVNQGWDFDHWRFQRLQSEVAVKVGATFRF